jgi:hypothetical protein
MTRGSAPVCYCRGRASRVLHGYSAVGAEFAGFFRRWMQRALRRRYARVQSMIRPAELGRLHAQLRRVSRILRSGRSNLSSRCFWGAKVPEQRSSSAQPMEHYLGNMSRGGGMPMMTPNYSEASASRKGMWNLVLLVVHVGVLVATMLLHPPLLNHADGALPKDISFPPAGRK